MPAELDPRQRMAAESRPNTVVTAGAGAGKTTVLAERFLWLVTERSAPIESLLVLTFTRKAAAEMHERIHRRLSQSASPLARTALERFGDAQISTLDGFCGQIVRNASEAFGLPPDFSTDEAGVQEIALRVSLELLLSRGSDPALIELLAEGPPGGDFEAVQRDLFADLAVTHLHLADRYDFPAMHARQMETLRSLLSRTLARVLDACAGLLRLPPRTPTIRKNQEAARSLPDLGALADREDYGQIEEALLGFAAMKKSGGKAGAATAEMNEAVDEIRQGSVSARDICATLAQSENLKTLSAFLEDFQAAFAREKRRLGVVGFRDVAEMAVKTLRENTRLRSYYKRKYRHIMIDEFQDNNSLQKNLLFLLAERPEGNCPVPSAADLVPDKLFFVGDQKQSIYLFRGADVSVFKSLASELEASGGCSHTLPTNYRSQPGLIDFFNAVFPSIMRNPLESYEAVFEPLEAPEDAQTRARHSAQSASSARDPADSRPPHVHLLYKPFSDGARKDFTDAQSEAYQVARYIARNVREKLLCVREGDGARVADWGDFAVLLRSTTSQIEIERMFRIFDVPYSTQAVRSLFQEAPLNDLYNLLQLAAYPDDRVAYAGFLRSPLVNLSDDSLARILLEGKGLFPQIDLPETEKEKLSAGRELLGFVQANADVMPLARLLSQVWHGWGYIYTILRTPRFHTFLEHIDYLIALASDFDKRGTSLCGFLDAIRPRLGTSETSEDLDILKEDRPGVQIMTIHRAKGLEFPVVVLAHAGSMGRSESSSCLYSFSNEHGFSFRVGGRNPLHAAGEEDRRKRELAEQKRLLYVALTRAKDHLIVSGCHTRQNRSAAGVHLNMLREALGLHDGELPGAASSSGRYNVSAELIPDLSPGQYNAAAGPGAGAVTDLRSSYKRASIVARSRVRVDFPITEVSRRLDESEKKGALASLPSLPIDAVLKDRGLEEVFGTLVHATIRLKGEGFSTGEIPESLRAEIPHDVLGDLVAAARELADRFFSSPLGTALAGAVSREMEVPFLYRIEAGGKGFNLSGQIDLLFETETEAHLVDFKTDKSWRPGDYGHQIGLYALAARALTTRKLSCHLFLLRNGTDIPVAQASDEEERARRLLSDISEKDDELPATAGLSRPSFPAGPP